MKTLYPILLLMISSFLPSDQFKESGFRENFASKELTHFRYGSTGRKSKFKWKSGVMSGDNQNALSFKLDPKEKAGPGKGPEIISKEFTYFGTYSTRLKVPDPRRIQPNVGAVVGYFTYHEDPAFGLSEIDFEWLIADPEVIYVGTWTGESGDLKRVGRTINLAKGIIYSTEYREDKSDIRKAIVGKESLPERIDPIPGFDASADFHTYGFDWGSDRIRWWMIHPVTQDTVVLWDYAGERGIPRHPSKYRLNFWHTNNWSVETNPKSLEKPAHRFELEVDWMEYTPKSKN